MTIILKGLNMFLTPQLVYNQMWINLFMDEYHFNKIAIIIIKTLHLIIFVKLEINNFSKNGHILHNGNNIVKNLMNAFLNSH